MLVKEEDCFIKRLVRKKIEEEINPIKILLTVVIHEKEKKSSFE
jgi:hypothetical protein